VIRLEMEIIFIDYHSLPTIELVKLAKINDQIAYNHIVNRYKNIISYIARCYPDQGIVYDDKVQEGNIGLFLAVQDFRFDKRTSFGYFAEMCIRRKMITAIKNANRQKHRPINDSISLYGLYIDDEKPNNRREDYIYSKVKNKILLRENQPDRLITTEDLNDYLHVLSDCERDILMLRVNGYSYYDISKELRFKDEKIIDNALFRARRKIQQLQRK